MIIVYTLLLFESYCHSDLELVYHLYKQTCSSSDTVPYPSDTHGDQWSQGQCKAIQGQGEQNCFYSPQFDVALSYFSHPENLLRLSENWRNVSHLMLI